MKELKQRILDEALVGEGDIIHVDMFLNHCMASWKFLTACCFILSPSPRRMMAPDPIRLMNDVAVFSRMR